MELEKVLLSRKSCRKFTDKAVELDKLEKVVVSASLAPLGLPRMCTPMLTVVTEKELLAGLKGIYDAPAVIIVSCPPSPAPGIGDQNAACVVEMMSLVATDLGLGNIYLYGVTANLQGDADMKAKLEILEGMDGRGTVILNGDDQLLWNLREESEVRGTYFGSKNRRCRICADDVQEENGKLRFRVSYDDDWFVVELPVEGEHFVSDALAAITVGLQLGVSQEKIQQSLSNFQNMAGRQEIFEAKGRTIIKDCYNAGPESMAAALTVLGNRTGRRVAVLGDMLELGTAAQAEHYRVGRIAAEKADLLLAYGPNSCRVISGAVTGGMPDGRAWGFEEQQELIDSLCRLSKPGDVILFKGSNGMHMDWILDAFLKDET